MSKNPPSTARGRKHDSMKLLKQLKITVRKISEDNVHNLATEKKKQKQSQSQPSIYASFRTVPFPGFDIGS